MARVEIPVTVINSSTGLPVSGAAIAVTRRVGGAAATWWPTEVGGSSSTASLITDANGRTTGWFDRGAYTMTISGAGITTYAEPWDAAPASDASVDVLWVPDASIAPAKFDAASVALLVPTGSVHPYAGTAAPTGYLMCDGAAVSRTTYAALFTITNTNFGIGDGATTFNVPDLRGRAPIGVDGTAARLASADGFAVGGGTETVTLANTDIPGFGGTVGTSAGNVPLKVSDAATLTGNPVNKMQPYLVLNYIIKT